MRTLPPTARLGSLDAVRANIHARYLTPREKIDRILAQCFPSYSRRSDVIQTLDHFVEADKMACHARLNFPF